MVKQIKLLAAFVTGGCKLMRDDFKSPKYQKLNNDLVLLGVFYHQFRKDQRPL